MVTVTLDEAKERLGELLDRVAAGDSICVTRDGTAIARIVGVLGEGRDEWEPIDLEELRALTDSMTPQTESAGDFIRRMRDEDRY